MGQIVRSQATGVCPNSASRAAQNGATVPFIPVIRIRMIVSLASPD